MLIPESGKVKSLARSYSGTQRRRRNVKAREQTPLLTPLWAVKKRSTEDERHSRPYSAAQCAVGSGCSRRYTSTFGLQKGIKAARFSLIPLSYFPHPFIPPLSPLLP
jgi:hypothetical protein